MNYTCLQNEFEICFPYHTFHTSCSICKRHSDTTCTISTQNTYEEARKSSGYADNSNSFYTLRLVRECGKC